MKKNKVIAGILSIGLLTTGALSVQAGTQPLPVHVSVPGLNQSSFAAPQTKTTSNMDGYLYIEVISGDNKVDGRAETGKLSNPGPYVRLSQDNAGYILENSIKKGDNIQVRFSSDVTTYLPITIHGTFQGN